MIGMSLGLMVTLEWIVLPPLPPAAGASIQPGLAGPVAGAQGKYVLLGGGANFENGLPWKGGTKVYRTDMFLLERLPEGEFVWTRPAEKLPFPLAYSACLSLPNGIVSLGGENDRGPVDDAVLFGIENGKIKRHALPSLPRPVTSAAAASIDAKIYLAGGADAAGETDGFLSLDLDRPEKGWMALAPLPEKGSHGVLVSQSDGRESCLYHFGGRRRTADVTDFSASVWKFAPSTGTWNREGNIFNEGKPTALAAGTGLAAGDRFILLFGGDPGILFNRTERLNQAISAASGAAEKRRLLEEKDRLLSGHPGFSRNILAYDTRTKTWLKTGELPGESAVTTVAFLWNGIGVIPSGEIRPGVRTPAVFAFKVRIER